MLNAPSRKNRCAFLNWCLPLEYSLMMRMTFWLVGMRRYIASWSTCGSYNGELISIIPSRKLQITDVLQSPTSHVPQEYHFFWARWIRYAWSDHRPQASSILLEAELTVWPPGVLQRLSRRGLYFIDTVPRTFSCNLNERSHEQWMSVWKDSSWAATGGRLAEAVTRWYN